MDQSKQRKQQPEKKQKKRSQPGTKLTFLEHIYELRTRLFWVVFALVVASAIGFQYKDQLIDLVMAPLHGQKLIYLTPGGGFSFIFTLSAYFGALLCIPLGIYHLFRFMEPLLGSTSRKLVATFIFLSAVLAAAGASFGYFVTVPAAIDFLATFAGTAVVPSLTAESYLNFVVTYIFGLAVIFQVPLLLFIVDYVRPLPPKALMSSQRYVVVAAAVISAIITPTPDAFNMAIVAAPIITVYELGALAVYTRHRVVAKRKVAPQLFMENEAPLTAIIEELVSSRAQREQAQQEEVLVDGVEADFDFDFDTPALELTPPEQVKAVEVVPAVLPEQPTRLTVVDGLVANRAAPSIPRPPVRDMQSMRMAQKRSIQTRPTRSIDGFSVMGRA